MTDEALTGQAMAAILRRGARVRQGVRGADQGLATPPGAGPPSRSQAHRLLRRDGRWRVYDVVVEGVSLVGSYRSQFDKVIRTSSYPELVKRLKDKEAATR